MCDVSLKPETQVKPVIEEFFKLQARLSRYGHKNEGLSSDSVGAVTDYMILGTCGVK